MKLIDGDALIAKARHEAEGMTEPFKSNFATLVEWLVDKMQPIEPEEKWTPCSERSPEDDERVLATTAWGDVTIAERIYQFINDIDNICWFIHDGNTNATVDDAIAWMPLPERYSGE